MDRQRGTTLLELLVALLVLSLTAGMATLAIQSLRPTQESLAQRELNSARSRAIREGVAVRVVVDTLDDNAEPQLLLFLPDGRVVGWMADSAR